MGTRTQHYARVRVRFDGDGQAWVWSPNISDPQLRIELEVTDDVAVLAHIGLTAPPAPAPERSANDVTVFVELDLGAEGVASVDGDPCSAAALMTLVMRGWLYAVRLGMEATLDPGASGEGRPR